MIAVICICCFAVAVSVIGALIEKLIEVQAQRDEAVKALLKISNWGSGVEKLQEIARNALSEMDIEWKLTPQKSMDLAEDKE